MAPKLSDTFYRLIANKAFVKFTTYIGIFTVLLVTIYNIIPHNTKVYLFSEHDTAACKPTIPSLHDLSCKAKNYQTPIPNIANFVYILRDPIDGDFPLQFSHFLSLYSAWHYWKPDTIYLHTNVDANSEAVLRAKNGTAGKWAQKLFNFPNLQINAVTVPTTVGNGQRIKGMEHKSDFVRVKAVHDHGGIYIDFDVYALQDIKPLRESGYAGIGGRQADGWLNSGTFLSVKGGAMIKGWMDTMNQVYDGSWVRHSNTALTDVSKALEGPDSCEVLMLDQAAFAPTGYRRYDSERLFREYYDDSGLVKTLTHGGRLPNDQNYLSADSKGWVSWKKDWSCSFLLHAFSEKKPRNGVADNGISPASVLARRSIFAKTVYPVVKHMYENGVIDRGDLE